MLLKHEINTDVRLKISGIHSFWSIFTKSIRYLLYRIKEDSLVIRLGLNESFRAFGTKCKDATTVGGNTNSFFTELGH